MSEGSPVGADGEPTSEQVSKVLVEALDLEGQARTEFVDQACADDRALRREVESLLAMEASLPAGFLETPAAESFLPADGEGRAELPDLIGRYRILESLGEGGMGRVFVAEQEEPVRRRVALKVVDAAHSRRQRLRFRAECQALARLSHPNIAAMYDSGETEDGHPYVAMELVEGATLNRWCDDRRLTLAERLEIFLGVCSGVGHAHEKGVLHRDLKPSNILVTEVDGKAVAKVIDFGIARALDVPLAEVTDITQDGLIGSPAYMSPEAFDSAKRRDLDTRSDVFSLGVMLYELLAGVLPFDALGVPLAVLLRQILEEARRAPSDRLAQLESDLLTQVAESRRTTPGGLRSSLRGDLDAIVVKAIARDREQRYGSAGELAADLGRHLTHRPVEARPGESLYILGRYLLRRKATVVAVGSIIVILVAGLIARGVEAENARQAAAEARQVSDFLLSVFRLADPESASGEVSARELLDRAADNLQDDLEDQPLARARFLHTIADIYDELGLFDRAEELSSRVLELRLTELASDDPAIAESLNQLAVIYRRMDRLDEAEDFSKRALAARQNERDPDPLLIAVAHNSLGNLLWSKKDYEGAEGEHRRALELRTRALPEGHPDIAESLNNLGVALREQHDWEGAAATFLEAAELAERELSNEHPRYAAAIHNLAYVKDKLMLLDEAEVLQRSALTLFETAYGSEHPRTASGRYQLRTLFVRAGRWQDALALQREVVESAGRRPDPNHRRLPREQVRLGYILEAVGERTEAEIQFRRALETYVTHHGAEDTGTLRARSGLAWLDYRQGRYSQAARTERRILDLRQRLYPAEVSQLQYSLFAQARALAAMGDSATAESLLRRCDHEEGGWTHAYTGSHEPGGAYSPADALLELGLLVEQSGRSGEGAELLQQALNQASTEYYPEHMKYRRIAEAAAASGRNGI